MQIKHDELEAIFFEERAALEAKYQKLYEPLYGQVYHFLWTLILKKQLLQIFLVIAFELDNLRSSRLYVLQL